MRARWRSAQSRSYVDVPHRAGRGWWVTFHPGRLEPSAQRGDDAAGEQKGVDEGHHSGLLDLLHLEAVMSRGGRPRIILEGGLHRLYRVFVGFHALAHRVWRPGHAEYYLGSPAWRPRIEIEASTVGFLALVRWRAGPVCPRIRRAHLDGAVMRFWGRCLRREADGWWATG